MGSVSTLTKPIMVNLEYELTFKRLPVDILFTVCRKANLVEFSEIEIFLVNNDHELRNCTAARSASKYVVVRPKESIYKVEVLVYDKLDLFLQILRESLEVAIGGVGTLVLTKKMQTVTESEIRVVINILLILNSLEYLSKVLDGVREELDRKLLHPDTKLLDIKILGYG